MIFWGFYCPPLIPAGIQQNPSNSQNSRGIKFGRGACQIDEMILAESQSALKLRQNGSRNYLEGMLPKFNRLESMMPELSISICQCLISVSSTNNAHSFSTTLSPTMSTHLATITNGCPHPSITHKHDSEDNVATPHHQANKCQPHQSGWKVPHRSGWNGYQTMNKNDVIICRFCWSYHGEHTHGCRCMAYKLE